MRRLEYVVLATCALFFGSFLLNPAYAQHTPSHGSPKMMMIPKKQSVKDKPIHITMEELHRHGGVPPGWRFRIPKGDPAAGREVFVKQECYTCHHVAGEKFSKHDRKSTEKGPDLTGMGAHHSSEYFFESILSPNRVITTVPGYTGNDGLSIMPSYSHLLTLDETINLTAYIKSLTAKGGHGQHRGAMKHDTKKITTDIRPHTSTKD